MVAINLECYAPMVPTHLECGFNYAWLGLCGAIIYYTKSIARRNSQYGYKCISNMTSILASIT